MLVIDRLQASDVVCCNTFERGAYLLFIFEHHARNMYYKVGGCKVANKQVGRDRVRTFRVNEAEERELLLTARSEGISPSELIRSSIAERTDRLVSAGASNGQRDA